MTSSLPARGVWIKSLTSTDANTNATIGYPTIDSTAHEPAPAVSPIFFPASPFTLEHSLAFGNERDYLNVSDQFRPTGPGDAGIQRHFNSGTFEIFYSQSSDQVAPLISEVNVSTTAGVATVTARVTDDSGPVAEVAALVNDGHWHYLQLTQSSPGSDALDRDDLRLGRPGGVRRGHRRHQRQLQREQGRELHLRRTAHLPRVRRS